MTIIYKLDLYPLKLYPQTKKWTFYVKAFESYTRDVQTGIHINAIKNDHDHAALHVVIKYLLVNTHEVPSPFTKHYTA